MWIQIFQALQVDQIDVDGIYGLKITNRKKWEHTNIKLNCELKSSPKPIHIVFIGEPYLMQMVHGDCFSLTLYFHATARYIMQGASSSFTLLNDVKKLNNG